MSFQNKGFWMKNAVGFPDSEIYDNSSKIESKPQIYDNSSQIEAKRPHQWFLDASDTDLFPSKKSAVEGSNGRPITGVVNVALPWETPSSFQAVQSVAGHFTDRLFGPEPPRTIDFGGRNFQSVSAMNLDIGRRGTEDRYGHDASVALSMSHTLDDAGSCLTYGGIRKVKVNQVKDSDHCMPIQMGNTYSRSDCNSISFNGFEEASEANSQPCRQEHVNDSGNAISIQMDHPFMRSDDNTISFDGFQDAHRTNPQPRRPDQVKDSGNSISIHMGNSFNRFGTNTISFSGFQDEHEMTRPSGRLSQVKDAENIMAMQLRNTFSKGDSNTISFNAFPVEPGMNNYDLVVRQSSLQQSEDLKEKQNSSNTDLVVSTTPVSAVSGVTAKAKSEPKESKKLPPNSFPSNVRSLLNTGMLDGVPVKYISWQHEELGGIIKGCGYMCGCNSCNYSKALNAYEFEKHAGTKTKHPNNHIYFENGKTIYAIVQELKSTPQKLLFEAIQNCTGSPINQKAFKTWKESYQAATRELERIYGKDMLKLSTSGED